MMFRNPEYPAITAVSRAAFRPMGLALAVVSMATSCRRPEEVAATTPAAVNPITSAGSEVLSFPAEVRSDHDAVNEFVTRSMKVSAAGDYDAFRLLWSVHDEPISQQEFMEGWRAVREIRVKALRKIRLTYDARGLGGQSPPSAGGIGGERSAVARSSPEQPDAAPEEPIPDGEVSRIAYALFAEVAFDPSRASAAQENPRQLALLVVPEQDQWRLAKPPKQMKSWIREQLAVLSPRTDSRPAITADKPDPGNAP